MVCQKIKGRMVARGLEDEAQVTFSLRMMVGTGQCAHARPCARVVCAHVYGRARVVCAHVHWGNGSGETEGWFQSLCFPENSS